MISPADGTEDPAHPAGRGAGRSRGDRERGAPRLGAADPAGGRDGDRSGATLFPDASQIPVVELSHLRSEPRRVNVPNGLTFLRALLVPVILWLLALDDPGARWWAFGIFLFAAATDSIDGWVARRWHGVTVWGQLADPIADKLLIIGSLASLAAVGQLPWWAVLTIGAREVAVTLLRLRLVARLDLVIPATAWGKAKTVSQVLAVLAFLWPDASPIARWTLLYVAIATTVLSGVDYALRAGRLARARREVVR